MRQSLSAALFAVCLLGAIPARGTLLWKGDFETSDLSQWDSSTLIKTGERDNLVLQGELVAEGNKAAKITLRDDVIFEPYNQSRVEVKHVGLHTKNGEDSYFAWSFMVPKDAEIRSNIGYWESTPSFKNTMTFFIEPAAGGGTNLKFGTGNLGETVRFTVKLALNQWHRVALHNHWSQSQADGKVDVWYDGVQVVTGATATKYNADGLFFQMGLHRSDPSPPVQDIYLDAAVETDSQEELLAPLEPIGMAGAGGMAGAAGAGAVAGAAPAGAGGMAMAGGAGAPLTRGGANGGADGGSAAGAPLAGMSVGGGLASAGTATSSVPANDDEGCGMARSRHGAAHYGAALLMALLLGRRRRYC
jgi:hypothetical protein